MFLRNCFLLTVAAGFMLPTGVHAECPLDHYFLAQEDEQLFVEKSRIYRHGDPLEGYYPLTWSPIYQRWSIGEPGFSDTDDPAYGFPPEIQLVGTPGVDYEIWFEILDLSPDFMIQMNDGTWLHAIGQRFNLSDWPEHHVHLKYCAYVPASPPPADPFHVTYRLVDDVGPYAATPPFSLVFNVPTPTVEETYPEYRGLLPSLTDAEISFTFHRAIAVDDGPAVTITDEATHSQDYYTGYFDQIISPDGLTLTLTQIGGTLPGETWLEIALTDHTRDAITGFPAVPFTHFAYSPRALGDLDGDGDVDADDVPLFVGALINTCAPPADLNGDGACDGLDVEGFVRALLGV